MVLQTVWHALHQQAGAQLVDFHGWQMPLHYGSQLVEHNAVRTRVGMFDVSHMGLLDIVGTDSTAFLRRVMSADVARISSGNAIYSCMLDHQGGVLDDLVIYRLTAADVADAANYRLVLNASRREHDFAWLQQQLAGYDASLNWRDDLALLAVQGPQSVACLQSMSMTQKLGAAAMVPFQLRQRGAWALASTGYTGECGFELMLPCAAAPELWHSCLQYGVQPCGLGARDSLRLEAGLNLYGQDMDHNTLPAQVRLQWTLQGQDPERDFIGRRACAAAQQQLAAGSEAVLRQVGLLSMQPGALRCGQEVVFADGSCGRITSAGFSPALKRSIALAQVPIAHAQASKTKSVLAHVMRRGKLFAVHLVQPPFVQHGKIKPQINDLLAASDTSG